MINAVQIVSALLETDLDWEPDPEDPDDHMPSKVFMPGVAKAEMERRNWRGVSLVRAEDAGDIWLLRFDSPFTGAETRDDAKWQPEVLRAERDAMAAVSLALGAYPERSEFYVSGPHSDFLFYFDLPAAL